ncbi:MAG: SAM-dependent methyltransferase [Paracoccaceae bacterium]
MTLRDQLALQIDANGPITVATYMHECLLNPDYGYYATRRPIGASGDFVTAPEISQMFGELIGLSLAQAWLDRGSPSPFALVELGPGLGTFMADILRACQNVPGFLDSVEIHLVEASTPLKGEQAQRLSGFDVTWHVSLETVPNIPLFLVANEFFDALPIRQFVRDGSGWRERQIGFADDALHFGLAQRQAQPALNDRMDDTRDGDLVEDCPSLAPVAHLIGKRIQKDGGVALIIDYGDWRSLGDTLQAVSAHEKCDPLHTPGQADLTAHVDFEKIALAAPCAHTRLTPQGVFLERLGITARAEALATRLSGKQLETHIAAHRRLTHPEEMGTLFKVLGLYDESFPPPPGLEP